MTDHLLPLVVALPLIVAALLAAAGSHLPRLVPDAVAIGCAAAVTAMLVILTLRSGDHTIVYWFGGWQPLHGFALGIAFVVDPLAAAEATLAALAVLAALVFAWGHFEEVRHFFHALMLTFLAGMVGFVLSGDLFDIFVFLELMSVAAYALSAYAIRRPEVIQGSMNFAVINSVGTFTLLMGIALLYGRTGNLNLVGIGQALSHEHPHGLLVAAFTCITVGFLVKAGAAPFHFWLSDAYAVATAPAAAICTAVMGDLAYDVYSRVHTTAFAGSIGDGGAVRRALLALAVLSAVVGAVMCFLQADLKRQVAFLTVSNGGVVLTGVAQMDAPGTAGSVMYIVAAGLLRGGLMLGLGMLAVRFGSTDELALRGRGRARGQLLLGAVVALCALGLAAPPGFGPFLSLSLVYESLDRTGYGPIAPLLAACVAVSAGAVLRATARVFLGWGAADDPALTRQLAAQPRDDDGQADGEREDDEEHPGRSHRPWALLAPLALGGAGWLLAFAPGLAAHALRAAQDLHDSAAHAALVLHGTVPTPRPLPNYAVSAAAWAYGAASFGGALAVAALGLWWQRLPGRAMRVLRLPVVALKSVHDGSVGDYIAWLVTGAGALALAWAAVLR